MWICARCGTEAQQAEMCSGCGSIMRPFPEPPPLERYRYVLIDKRDFACYGPFLKVIDADSWAEAHLKHQDCEVVLMEFPIP